MPASATSSSTRAYGWQPTKSSSGLSAWVCSVSSPTASFATSSSALPTSMGRSSSLHLPVRGPETLVGEIAAQRHLPDVPHAAAHYQHTLAEEFGMRPLQAHCHRCRGQLYATA